MESMEYDSDPDEHSATSPMQHSGWEPCQKVLSCVKTVSAFRPGALSQTDSQNSVAMAAENQGSRTFFSAPATFHTPDSRWNKPKSLFSAVGAFGGFRTATSPPECEKNIDLSDEDCQPPLNNNSSKRVDPFSFNTRSSEGIRLWSAQSGLDQINQSGTHLEKSVSSDMVTNKEGTNAQDISEPKISWKHNSLQLNSAVSASQRRHSLAPELLRSKSQRSTIPAKLPKLSEVVDKSSNVSLRRLCKPTPAKRRKVSPEVVNVNKGPKKAWSQVKSFVIVNFLIGVILSVYALDLFSAKCGSISDFSATALRKELESKVYGQHIASEILPHLLQEYLLSVQDGNTSKPLVLSFHGWTGVGKNFVSKIVSDFFPYRTVNKLLVPLHFAHESMEDIYAQVIPAWIVGNLTKCHLNFVIMDEMDKASDGVVRGLKVAVDKIVQLNDSHTPVVVLLLSNSRGAQINKHVFQLTSSGRARESISHKDMLEVFQHEEKSWYSDLATLKIIDTFVPFLPLEKDHIVQCIKQDMEVKGLREGSSVVRDVVQELSFFKSRSGLEFSQTGCKRVSDKVNLVYHKHDS